jgi:hypothetical protein
MSYFAVHKHLDPKGISLTPFLDLFHDFFRSTAFTLPSRPILSSPSRLYPNRGRTTTRASHTDRLFVLERRGGRRRNRIRQIGAPSSRTQEISSLDLAQCLGRGTQPGGLQDATSSENGQGGSQVWSQRMVSYARQVVQYQYCLDGSFLFWDCL